VFDLKKISQKSQFDQRQEKSSVL